MRELRSKDGELGLSYEVSDAIVEDMKARVWKLTDVTFTGAALLLREKAAYGQTWFRLEDQMSAEEMKQLIATAERMAAAAEAMQSAVTRIEAQNAELAQKVERIVAEVESEPSAVSHQPSGRKTIDPVVGVLLAKSGVDVDKTIEVSALDASLATLPLEQRIAVKMQLARAGLLS